MAIDSVYITLAYRSGIICVSKWWIDNELINALDKIDFFYLLKKLLFLFFLNQNCNKILESIKILESKVPKF